MYGWYYKLYSELKTLSKLDLRFHRYCQFSATLNNEIQNGKWSLIFADLNINISEFRLMLLDHIASITKENKSLLRLHLFAPWYLLLTPLHFLFTRSDFTKRFFSFPIPPTPTDNTITCPNLRITHAGTSKHQEIVFITTRWHPKASEYWNAS